MKPNHSTKIMSGNKIVWMDNSNGNAEIKMRYINSDPLLLLNTDFPSTNGSLLVWCDNRGETGTSTDLTSSPDPRRPSPEETTTMLYPRGSGR